MCALLADAGLDGFRRHQRIRGMAALYSPLRRII